MRAGLHRLLETVDGGRRERERLGFGEIGKPRGPPDLGHKFGHVAEGGAQGCLFAFVRINHAPAPLVGAGEREWGMARRAGKMLFMGELQMLSSPTGGGSGLSDGSKGTFHEQMLVREPARR